MNTDDVEEAAGGLLWKNEGGQRRLALVYRERHGGGWTIPKGKRKPGEKWLKTAIREVKEETGCTELEVGEFAGCICYDTGERPKVVLFWHMEMKTIREASSNDDEVKEVKWFTLTEARKVLRYPKEKNFLNTVE